MNAIPERDWKYLRRVQGQLLEALCSRINGEAEASQIVADHSLNQHERFLRLYAHVIERDAVVADCFDDWRRSNMLLKLLLLRKHRLLTDEHISKLSTETQRRLNAV
jgi:hypothetical protein